MTISGVDIRISAALARPASCILLQLAPRGSELAQGRGGQVGFYFCLSPQKKNDFANYNVMKMYVSAS